jgi:hypothetical protein
MPSVNVESATMLKYCSIMLTIVIFSLIMLSVNVFSVGMLYVIMLSVVMLNHYGKFLRTGP